MKKQSVWIGGVVHLLGADVASSPVTAMLWIDQKGRPVGVEVGEPGSLVEKAAHILRWYMKHPPSPEVQVPKRVRVASDEIASVLRPAFPSIEVVVEPTPELDALSESFGDYVRGQRDESSSLVPLVSVDARDDFVSSWFQAAAKLYSANPWDGFDDGFLFFSVDIVQFGVEDWVLAVYGDQDEGRSLALFPSRDDAVEFWNRDPLFDRVDDKLPQIPPQLNLVFEHEDNLEPQILEDILVNGWELAGPHAVPLLVVVDKNGIAQPPHDGELIIATAVAGALVELLRERDAMLLAWARANPMARTFNVTAGGEPVSVTLGLTNLKDFSEAFRPPFDLKGRLLALDAAEQDGIRQEISLLNEELVRRFAENPYYDSSIDPDISYAFLMFAYDFFGRTVFTLDPLDMEEMLFGVFPRKLPAQPAEGPTIVRQLHVFYQYLESEFDFEQANAFLQRLNVEAADRLAKELADPRNFDEFKQREMLIRESWTSTIEMLDYPTDHSKRPASDNKSSAVKKRRAKNKKAKKARRKGRTRK